jgi:hypothetical protein
MSTTPLWVPLLVAALGVVSTLVGIVVTQIMANRRERANWTRELQREQTRWSREDQARTFSYRRVAYVQFYESLRSAIARINFLIVYGSDGARMPEGWYYELFEKLQHVEMYGSADVVTVAQRAFEVTQAWGDRAGPAVNDEDLDYEVSGMASTLLDAIRKDLGVPETPERALPASESQPDTRRASNDHRAR